MNYKILIAIVIYKEVLNRSESYRTINIALKKTNIEYKFYIHDNSLQKQIIEDKNIHYVHTKNNIGLSKAYNNAALYAKLNHYNWIILLDQDTTWDENYFIKIKEGIINHPKVKLFVPQLLLHNNKKFSPVRYIYGRAYQTTLESGIHSLHKYFPVNSGLIINVDAFLKVGGYNEHVYLDHSDFQFIERFRKKYSNFCLIDSIGYQNFSNDEIDICRLKNRFIMYLDCLLHCDRPNIIYHISYLYSTLRHTMALSLRTKNSVFIKIFTTNYLLKK